MTRSDQIRIMKRVSIFVGAILFCLAVPGGFSYAHPPGEGLPSDAKAIKVLVEKSNRKLSLFRDGTVWKTYRIALGKHPIGPKRQEGDQKTPEGIYQIDFKNQESSFHLALHISYPSPSDIRKAKELGVSPGGNIMIHGVPEELGWMGKLHRLMDWTAGCIAVTNSEIEELWSVVPVGTPVEIVP